MPDRSLRLLTFPPRPAQGGEGGAALLRERPTWPPAQTPRGGPEGSGQDGSGRGGANQGGSGHGGSGADGSGHGGPGQGGSGYGGPGQGGSGQGGSGRDGGRQDDNPFAPPPEGTPDQPWQPRHPGGASGHGPGHGHGPGWGGAGQGQTPGGAQGPTGGQGPDGHSPWGGQWSDRQPGRSPGGFGERPGGGPQGPGGPTGSGMRWDPTDPAQRRARYALLSGMWSVFFVLFSWPYVALLLGALALYWGTSALRAKPRRPSPDSPANSAHSANSANPLNAGNPANGANPVPPGAPPAPPAQAGRPQRTAAVTGLVTASLALVLVASTFTVQLVYRDYYTCVGDALTHEAKQSCETLLPRELRGVLGNQDG
ncbi:hypothetical protein [Streptomyces sp. SID161]|uniref:hypothetical protein n=1 Tax=Streptomyces sp. SID161 TaxID=2690251 RepID=UPI00136AC285|nr:hypothetical protein [Streptomyces sp. SID161]MYW48078.1 hypothetical protein [Streptomyces sp. SID161]